MAPGIQSIKKSAPSEELCGMLERDGAVIVEDILTPEELTNLNAEMKAGSALFYLGSAIHGGVANETTDQHRRGMFLGYVVGWLRTEENMFLTVPIENVRSMPTRIQELLGYKAHGAIGVVDVGSPMVLLEKCGN